MSDKGFIRVKIDATLKDDAERILNNMGLTAPAAITQFYQQVVAQKGLPYSRAASQHGTRELDDSWMAWIRENIERGASNHDILDELLKNNFRLASIQAIMGDHYPLHARPHDATPKLDDKWHAWIAENIERKASNLDILNELLRNKFPVDDIKAAMGKHYPGLPEERVKGILPGVDYKAMCEVRITDPARSPAKRFDTKLIQVYTLEDFMTPAECDHFAALINQQLRPSTVSAPSKDDGYDGTFRTSSTSDLSLLTDPLIAEIDRRISEALGVGLGYSEPIQAQKYEVGQQFKAHTDFFEPNTDEYEKHASVLGNRTWTFMVYLNDGMHGGATRFMNINHAFTPRKGMAVIWNNRNKDGTVNYNAIHAGEPVEVGEKYVITKWFRERGEGQLFL